MGNKINVAEILKDKPQGTKLYDLLRNIDVELDKVNTTDVGTYIECTSTNEVGSTLLFDYSKLGTEKCWLAGLRILLPSKNMRDWASSPGRRAICLSIVVDFSAFSKNGHLMIIQSSTDAILIAGMVTKTYQMQKQLSLSS